MSVRDRIRAVSITLTADLNGDCRANFLDFGLFANDWLNDNLTP